MPRYEVDILLSLKSGDSLGFKTIVEAPDADEASRVGTRRYNQAIRFGSGAFATTIKNLETGEVQELSPGKKQGLLGRLFGQ